MLTPKDYFTLYPEKKEELEKMCEDMGGEG